MLLEVIVTYDKEVTPLSLPHMQNKCKKSLFSKVKKDDS